MTQPTPQTPMPQQVPTKGDLDQQTSILKTFGIVKTLVGFLVTVFTVIATGYKLHEAQALHNQKVDIYMEQQADINKSNRDEVKAIHQQLRDWELADAKKKANHEN